MLLTLTITHRPATGLDFLLYKHPQRCQSFKQSFGAAHVFHPEVHPERCTAALLLDIDPVALVRGAGQTLAPYVNDCPYVASSMSVALAYVFGTMLSGRFKERLELLRRRSRW